MSCTWNAAFRRFWQFKIQLEHISHGFLIDLGVQVYEKEHLESKLEKMAIATYCNLRRPDVAPVVLGFNYETHNAQGLQIQYRAYDIRGKSKQKHFLQLLLIFQQCVQIFEKKITQPLSNKIYTLSPTFVELHLKMTNLFRFNQEKSHFAESAANELSLVHINKAATNFTKRLTTCVAANGGHVKHLQ